jgi:putative ABC transport system permease protein
MLALALASVGVFGVMSTVVGRRVREVGIRLALGAGKGDVLRLMLRKSMRPVAIGALVGVLACFGAARLLSSLLFGVGALDPYALTGAAAAVLGAAFLASAIPARRAMKVDPMTTLRHE